MMKHHPLALSVLCLVCAAACGSRSYPEKTCNGVPCDQVAAPVCGDGERGGFEECDGQDLGNQTCAGLGFAGGELGCSSKCAYDATRCCRDTCAFEGATQCQEQRVFACDREVSACLAWRTVSDCALLGSTCETTATGAACASEICTDACGERGKSRCQGEVIELCSQTSNGCLSWVAAGDCGASGRTCDDSGEVAVCKKTCTDACPGAGQNRCSTTEIQSCAFGSDGCLAWQKVVDCAETGQLCDDAGVSPACIGECTDACSSGAKRCAGETLLQSCAMQSNGCLGWKDQQECGAQSQVCDATGPSAQCVEPKTVLSFHFNSGFGNRITLRGSGAGLSWDSGVDCAWSDGNIWRCTMQGLRVGDEFKPLFNDSVWAPGKNWVVRSRAGMDVYPFFVGRYGEVKIWTQVYSHVLDRARDVAIFLPVSYPENPAKTYPIVFMQDGQNVFNAATSFLGIEWKVDEALNDLSRQGGIEEVIVVAPYNAGDMRRWEYTPTLDPSVGDGGGANAYLDFLLTELKPLIVQNFRTKGADAKVGIVGSSFGGVLSLYACWTRPQAFDRCGVFSPALWWDSGYLLNLVKTHTGPKPDVKIYLDSGDTGPGQDGMALTTKMRDALVNQGYVLDEDLKYVLGVGDEHNETAWAKRTPGALTFLLDDPDRAD